MIRPLALLIAIFFLPSIASAAWQPELRIGLFETNKPLELKFSIPTSFGSTARVSLDRNKLMLNGEPIEFDEIEFRPKFDAQLREMIVTLDDKKYFGSVKLVRRGEKILVINLTTTEEYLRGVLPVEMSSGWHEEALKAQAIAARTFALKNRRRHEADGYDLCSTSHCQTYKGVEVSARSCDEAIEKTFGEVMKFDGSLIIAAFHTDSGGRTASAEEVWGSELRYLRSIKESERETMPWTLEIESKEFGVGKIKSIRLERSESGRVKKMIVVGKKKTLELGGNEMRSRFGLKSTLFEAKLDGDSIEIKGYGSGHGVGMSQYGAKRLAERGSDHKEILTHYYSGVGLEKIY